MQSFNLFFLPFQSTQAEQREVDLYESLGATAPPLSPRWCPAAPSVSKDSSAE